MSQPKNDRFKELLAEVNGAYVAALQEYYAAVETYALATANYLGLDATTVTDLTTTEETPGSLVIAWTSYATQPEAGLPNVEMRGTLEDDVVSCHYTAHLNPSERERLVTAIGEPPKPPQVPHAADGGLRS
jgi:hypothetical protein